MKILESQSMPVDIIFESELRNETMLNTIKGLEKEIKAGLETLALSLPDLPMEKRILVTSGEYENEVGTLVDTKTMYKTTKKELSKRIFQKKKKKKKKKK